MSDLDLDQLFSRMEKLRNWKRGDLLEQAVGDDTVRAGEVLWEGIRSGRYVPYALACWYMLAQAQFTADDLLAFLRAFPTTAGGAELARDSKGAMMSYWIEKVDMLVRTLAQRSVDLAPVTAAVDDLVDPLASLVRWSLVRHGHLASTPELAATLAYGALRSTRSSNSRDWDWAFGTAEVTFGAEVWGQALLDQALTMDQVPRAYLLTPYLDRVDAVQRVELALRCRPENAKHGHPWLLDGPDEVDAHLEARLGTATMEQLAIVAAALIHRRLARGEEVPTTWDGQLSKALEVDHPDLRTAFAELPEARREALVVGPPPRWIYAPAAVTPAVVQLAATTMAAWSGNVRWEERDAIQKILRAGGLDAVRAITTILPYAGDPQAFLVPLTVFRHPECVPPLAEAARHRSKPVRDAALTGLLHQAEALEVGDLLPHIAPLVASHKKAERVIGVHVLRALLAPRRSSRSRLRAWKRRGSPR